MERPKTGKVISKKYQKRPIIGKKANVEKAMRMEIYFLPF